MSLLLTTINSITISELIDTDNNPASFVHPIVDEDLLAKWSPDDIRSATSLQTAINNGDCSLTYNGSNVSDVALFGLGVGRLYNSIRAITTSDTATFNDEIIVFNGPVGQTATLPDPSGRVGENITIKNSSPNTLSVTSALGTIDGFASISIEGVIFASITFVSDGTGWIAI